MVVKAFCYHDNINCSRGNIIDISNEVFASRRLCMESDWRSLTCAVLVSRAVGDLWRAGEMGWTSGEWQGQAPENSL